MTLDAVVELAGGMEAPLSWARLALARGSALRDRQQGAPLQPR